MREFEPGKLLRQDLAGFPPYIASSVAIADMERVIKLDANENPFGPSPKALAALADTRAWNRYATQDELRPAIARYVGVDAEHIVVGNGADEVIDLVERIFLQPGDAIVDCPPSFEMYGKYATINGARVIEVPRQDDFSIDVEAIERVFGSGDSVIASEVKQSSTWHRHPDSLRKIASQKPLAMTQGAHPKIVFVANPNNPDGSLTPPQTIERLLALAALIVLDEAYTEFSGGSLVDRVPTQPNLVVLRTFSKWAGLAGLRVGYCVAPKRIADQILRTKSPYNVNAAAIVAARASLEDAEYLKENVRRIIAERGRLFESLARLSFLQPLPTTTNFILCRVNGRSPRELRDALARRGILIRAFGSPRLKDYVRISVGTPEQDDALLRALEEV